MSKTTRPSEKSGSILEDPTSAGPMDAAFFMILISLRTLESATEGHDTHWAPGVSGLFFGVFGVFGVFGKRSAFEFITR